MASAPSHSIILLGGTGNLGTTILPVLLDAGYHVVVFSRRTVQDQVFQHENITFSVGSLDDPQDIAQLITAAIADGRTLRAALFLNGGYGADDGIGAEGFTSQLRKLMEMNVYPTTRVLEQVLPHWKIHGGGKVVLVSATAVNSRFVGGGAYATAKMAVDSLARQIQREYNSEVVDVHVVRPRFIGTKPNQNDPIDLAQEMLKAIK